jgi:2-C-methyl-D-erythritol 4-phosphate cytidylyltransferase
MSHPTDPQAAVRPWSAVIVAAGLGTRMGGDVKKPYLQVAGRPILHHTVERFMKTPGCEDLVLVVHPAEHAEGDAARQMEAEFGLRKVVAGGRTRRHSVLAGLEATDPALDAVLIHDGVRPNVRCEVIVEVVRQVREHGAAIAAVPATETVKVVDTARRIEETPERDSLWFARTPQGFRRELILEAHRRAEHEGYDCTDDAQLVEWLGGEVVVVPDDYANIKITTPSDLLLAEALLGERE